MLAKEVFSHTVVPEFGVFTKAAGSPLAFWGVRDSRPAAVN
ncbi:MULTISPECIES: hypothetical protein [Nostoc]|nr:MULTISPECIES: hypothetical protein [Nostoc]